MLLAERVEGVEPSRHPQRVAKFDASADRALGAACVGWRRSVRDFDRAVSAAARRAESGRRVSNALQLGDKTICWTQEISQISAITVKGLQNKGNICVEALKQCGLEPAKHIDDLVLSCVNDAEHIFAEQSIFAGVSPVSEAAAACNFTLGRFTDDLFALQEMELSAPQERSRISELGLRNEELMKDILRLTLLCATSPGCVVAKGDALRRLIDAEHWECAHRRDLAISFCDDLRALTASLLETPSLLSRASKMMESFTRR